MMRYVFLGSLLILIIASIITYSIQPESVSEVPILYWVTDPNPAREQQIETFKKWLAKHPEIPKFDIKVDTANVDPTKTVIQAVSGVAGDLIDHCHGDRIHYYTQIGFLQDVTEDAKKLGFDTSKTYPAIVPDITDKGRQYTFPCNVYVQLLWINKKTFNRFNQPLPPREWDIETFEKMGREYVQAANAGLKQRRFFYVDHMKSLYLIRSMGLDIFNETLTACIADDPRYVKALELIWKWTNEDHLIPTAAEQQSFSTEAGYGGSTFQLFNSGNYAMVWCGRYALIQFRKFGQMELSVAHPPKIDFPNTEIGTRATGVYAAGKHKMLAKYFLAYLASEDYNMNIVEDADALPPNPKYTELEAFIRPPKYPNEWGCHEVFSEAAKTIAISRPRSPFVLATTSNRIIWQQEDAFKSGIKNAQETVKAIAQQINLEIQRSLQENPAYQPLYNEYLALQKKIDQYKEEGKKVPISWIKNPFYQRWYRYKGLCIENE